MDEVTVGFKSVQGFFMKTENYPLNMKVNHDCCQKSFNKIIGECKE